MIKTDIKPIKEINVEEPPVEARKIRADFIMEKAIETVRKLGFDIIHNGMLLMKNSYNLSEYEIDSKGNNVLIEPNTKEIEKGMGSWMWSSFLFM